jgi:hypothetical protein
MPDEPELAKVFGFTKGRHGRSRFPVARCTFLELTGLNVIWDYRLDEYTCSEDEQWQEMWESLPPGCICLLDRKFCSFYNLAKLRRRRVAAVAPLHQKRDPHRLIARGMPLGKNQWRVPLDISPQCRRMYDDPSLPEVLWVRLIRVCYWRGTRRKVLWLVTTLMDPVKYPAGEVAELHRTRWGIETRIGTLKTTLEMNVLRGKSVNAVRREVASTVLGHNLVWMLMHEAAAATQTPLPDISFAGAVKTAMAFSMALRLSDQSQRPRLRNQMLRHIARQTNHHPFGRVEPRLIKRDTYRYPYLKESRWKARKKCLS